MYYSAMIMYQQILHRWWEGTHIPSEFASFCKKDHIYQANYIHMVRKKNIYAKQIWYIWWERTHIQGKFESYDEKENIYQANLIHIVRKNTYQANLILMVRRNTYQANLIHMVRRSTGKRTRSVQFFELSQRKPTWTVNQIDYSKGNWFEQFLKFELKTTTTIPDQPFFHSLLTLSVNVNVCTSPLLIRPFLSLSLSLFLSLSLSVSPITDFPRLFKSCSGFHNFHCLNLTNSLIL